MKTEKFHSTSQARALGALGVQLDPARAVRAAESVLAILGDSDTLGGVAREFITYPFLTEALTEVAQRLDAQGGLRTAEGLVLVLRKAKDMFPAEARLRAALVSVCRRLDAPGAARVSEAMVAAVRDPQTSFRARTLFADALVVLGGQLDPARAASLEDALVDALLADLADAKSLLVNGRVLLSQALASVCGRPGARRASRTAEALVAAIRDPQTPLSSLKPLAEALAAVGGQLTPTEASFHAKRAVEVLASLWVAKTGCWERASLAKALAAMWTRLDPKEAAAHARKTAADLEAALWDAKPTMNEYHLLVEALAAVYGHLGPAERATRANAVADALLAVRRRPKKDLPTVIQLSEALAMLCVHLDRPGVLRVADVLLTVLGEPDVRRHRFEFREVTFKKVAARLEEPDLQRLLDHPLAAGRVQRFTLDVLGGSRQRRFRNTWDYLVWTESHGKRAGALSPGTNR
jgi:hypothetical protein